MTAAAIPADRVVARERTRVLSLDVLRGAAIVGMIVVNSAAYLKFVGGYPAYPWLMHSAWAGFTLADAVFPAFIFMVGVSLVWSLEPVKRRGDDRAVAHTDPGSSAAATAKPFPPRGGREPTGAALQAHPGDAVRDIVLRALRLFLVGVLLSNIYWLADPSANPFRPMGVLQRIGLVYLAAALLYLTTGPRTRLAIVAVLLLAWWPLLLLPTPDGAATDLSQSRPEPRELAGPRRARRPRLCEGPARL